MLKPNEIMDAVGELIRERFPGENIYRNITPIGFTRPSFLIAYGPQKMQDASAGALELETALVVTAFAQVGEYNNSPVEELLRRMMAVQELFAVEGLRVGNREGAESRVLHVKGNTGVCNFDYAEVTIVLNYLDDRPGDGRQWPRIEAVEVKTNLEGRT